MTTVQVSPAVFAPDGIAPSGPPAQLPRPSRILVVEGDSLYRLLLGKALSRGRWSTDVVDSADAAIAAFGRGGCAMVVVGTDDRRLNGYEVARRLREIEKPGTRTPIVALTGDTLESDRKKRKAAGIDNYVAKPIRPLAIESMLARYLEPEGPDENPAGHLAAVDERCVSDLLHMVDGDTNQLKELMEASLSHVVELMDTMRRAEEDGDLGALWSASRALKNISAQIGAGRICDICSTIEALANTRSSAGVDALLQELSFANERAQRDLRAVQVQINRPSPRRPAGPAAPGEVLVAEGDALTARFLVTALTNSGFKVTHASDGNAALARIAAHAFQALVVNAALAGVDGFGVLVQLRLLPRHEHTPVILLSSRGSDQDVVRAFELGADDHIAVPFNPMEVIARIQRLIRVP